MYSIAIDGPAGAGPVLRPGLGVPAADAGGL